MAELTIQFLREETPVADAARRSGVRRIKLINPPRENHWPGKDVLGRFENDAFDGECLSYGAAGADLWWQRYGPEVDARPWITRWEFLNERECKTPAQAQALATITDRWVDIAAARKKGGTVLNFGEGQSEIGLGRYFWPLAKKARQLGFLFGFHEYWYPRLGAPDQATWHYWRLQRFFEEMAQHARASGESYVQVGAEVTECGVDGGVTKAGQKGWRGAGISEAAYIADLVPYRDGLPSYVYTAYVFCAGHFGKPWDSFDVTTGVFDGMVMGNPATTALPGAQGEAPPVSTPTMGPAFALDPWVVANKRPMTVAEFAVYIRSLPKPAFKEQWLHHTATEPVRWTYQTLLNVRDYYRGLEWYDSAGRKHVGWSGGPHLFIGEEGIWPFNPLTVDGIHAAGHNVNTFGVEMIGTFDAVKPKPATWDQTIAVMSIVSEVWGIPADALHLRFHREASTKTCPGKLVVKGDVLVAIAAWRQKEAPPYLPEYVERDVWDPLGIIDKDLWWTEEARRARERGDAGRADQIEVSRIRWLESRRERLRAA